MSADEPGEPFPGSMADFSRIFNAQKDQELQELSDICTTAWAEGRALDLETLKHFAFAGPHSKGILRKHPFTSISDAMAQIEAAFGILKNARDQIVDEYGVYHADMAYNHFRRFDSFSVKLTQLVFQFVFASDALVQSYRRLLSVAPQYEKNFQAARNVVFVDDGLSDFVKKLRNCYGHQKIIIVIPGGSVRYSETKEVSSSIIFNKKELLSMPEVWNQAASVFMERNDVLNVVDILDEYFQRAESLFRSYAARVGIYSDPNFQELSRCREAIKFFSMKISLDILTNGTKSSGINPYAYLSKYFTEDEVRRIHCLPAHSREQLNYMISLRDVLGLMDSETRERLEDLFSAS